ncbi:UspA [gamma proteobacterium HTCC5015]|nr:UspA [gamma proteobacterium HTCC5015]
MTAYQTIIAAVDLGDDSRRVIQRALELAGQGNIHVLHVVESFENLYVGDDWFGGGLNALELQQSVEQQRKEQLATLVGDVGNDRLKMVVHSGSPAAEIRAYAAEVDADLIVVGTHGRHGLELLLGSISNGVLHGTPCDVLAVKV